MLESLERAARLLLDHAAEVFLSTGSTFSIASLASALVIAALSLAWSRFHRRRAVKVGALVRALFPRRILRSASTQADLGMLLFNAFAAIVLIGWAVASAGQISRPTAQVLASALGPGPHFAMAPVASRTIATLVLFLAYELAYWFDHFLSHRVPILWEFHKVHHTAEVLSPLTVFRVHPIDSLLFANIGAIAAGLTGGVLSYLLGPSVPPFGFSGTNAILVGFIFLTVHLQHSHIWISFPGLAGRIFMSPAHHQIHHSADPIHFNRNFGSCLSVWDWAFGTLHQPARRREALTFGADLPEGAAPHSVTGLLITPFADALALAGAALGRAPRGRVARP